jgi:hypothetical protein
MRQDRISDGRASVVRHSHGPERTIQTGIGSVPVKRVKLRYGDAENAASGSVKITFRRTIMIPK